MILRRIIDHVKDQNWTAIVLDFVIVVSGVLIAFQVTEWSKAREDATRQRAAIDRLHSEAETVVTYLDRMVAMYDVQNDFRSEAIRRMIDNDWDGADKDNMASGIGSIGLLPAAAPPRSAYDEVINSGLFADLGDTNLRTAIANYYRQLDFLQGQITYIRSWRHIYPDFRHKGYNLSFEPGTERETKTDFDFDLISNDPDFIEGIVAANNSLRALTGWWRDTAEEARIMCEELARQSGRPCVPVPEETLR